MNGLYYAVLYTDVDHDAYRDSYNTAITNALALALSRKLRVVVTHTNTGTGGERTE